MVELVGRGQGWDMSCSREELALCACGGKGMDSPVVRGCARQG